MNLGPAQGQCPKPPAGVNRAGQWGHADQHPQHSLRNDAQRFGVLLPGPVTAEGEALC